MSIQRPIEALRDPLNRAFSLPRLPREYYQADAAVFWTLTVFDRAQVWLTPSFHQRFRELLLHAAAREGLLCPISGRSSGGFMASCGSRMLATSSVHL